MRLSGRGSVDDVEQVDGVELLGGAELRQTLDGGAVVGEGRDDREGRPAAALPLLAKKIGFDPAVMASPFITTVVDAISLAIYFRFAALLLGI